MIMLSNTTETLNVDMRLAAAMDVTASYADLTSTSYTSNGRLTAISTAANTIIVTSPAAGTQREIKTLTFVNRAISTIQFYLTKGIAGTDYRLASLFTLKARESLQYDRSDGWTYYDWNGRSRNPGQSFSSPEGFYRSPLFVWVNTLGTRLIPSGTTVATYIGRAPKTSRKLGVKYRVTTAGATVTWGEIGVATGVPSIGNNATLTVLGVNTANNPITLVSPGVIGSANGTYLTMIDLNNNYTINEGDDVWVLFGNVAGTGTTLRASTLADDLKSGMTQTAVTQPSLNIGTPVLYTIDATATANAPFYFVATYY